MLVRQNLPWIRQNWFKVVPLMFMALAAVQLAHHDQWLDELQAWALVVESPTLPALFHNLGYAGHPGLWYVLLWGVSRITGNAEMAKVLHWGLASGAIALAGYASPFRQRDRILLLAGYFLMFQYVVISRNYAVGMLLAFLYAVLATQFPQRRKTLYLTLGLLANSTVFSCFLSAALVAGRLGTAAASRENRQQALKAELPGLLVYAFFAGLFVWTVYPPADMRYGLLGVHEEGLYSFSSLLNVLWTFCFSFYFQGSKDLQPLVMAGIDILPAIKISLSGLYVAVFAIPLIILSSFRRELFVYTLTILVSVLFCFLAYRDYEARHSGILWLSFITCLWLTYRRRGALSPLFTLYLAVFALVGLRACIVDWKSPYSNDTRVTSWIASHQLQDKPWISYPDYPKVALFARLGAVAYSPLCDCLSGRIIWNATRTGISPEQVAERMTAFVQSAPGQEAWLAVTPVRWPEIEKLLAERSIKAELLIRMTEGRMDQTSLYHLSGN